MREELNHPSAAVSCSVRWILWSYRVVPGFICTKPGTRCHWRCCRDIPAIHTSLAHLMWDLGETCTLSSRMELAVFMCWAELHYLQATSLKPPTLGLLNKTILICSLNPST